MWDFVRTFCRDKTVNLDITPTYMPKSLKLQIIIVYPLCDNFIKRYKFSSEFLASLHNPFCDRYKVFLAHVNYIMHYAENRHINLCFLGLSFF